MPNAAGEPEAQLKQRLRRAGSFHNRPPGLFGCPGWVDASVPGELVCVGGSAAKAPVS